MCSVTHVAVGALIGSLVDNHLAAFVLGFASHLPLDVIPHFDFKDYRVDALITVAMLGGLLLAGGFSPLLLAALGAVAPDFENLLWKTGIIDEKRKIFPTHSGAIGHGRALTGGMPAEIAVSAFSVAAAVLAVVLRGMLRGGVS
jgi:hypothetical protein